MTGTRERDAWRAALHRMGVAVCLAARHSHSLPNRTPSERVARANAMIAALRIPRTTGWRPTFPFDA